MLLAVDGAQFGAAAGDARRRLLARLVINHRLRADDRLAAQRSGGEQPIIDRLLEETAVSLGEATGLVDAATPWSLGNELRTQGPRADPPVDRRSPSWPRFFTRIRQFGVS